MHSNRPNVRDTHKNTHPLLLALSFILFVEHVIDAKQVGCEEWGSPVSKGDRA